MASLDGWYLNPHITQYDGSYYEHSNCGPTSAANGANAATGGLVARTGRSMRALLASSEESSPATPGWSLVDIDNAMVKIGVPYENKTGYPSRTSSQG